MSNYKSFSKFYDAVMGKPTEKIQLLQDIINEFAPDASSLLELACGTGNILCGFKDKYAVTGLDLSPEMLRIARKKVTKAKLVQGNMADFKLNEKFDVVLCVFDSINHLLTFKEWKKMFENVYRHQKPGDLFVFDFNTLPKLKEFSQLPPRAVRFGRNYLIMDITQPHEKDIFNWNVIVFEHTIRNKYVKHEENILEAAFPLEDIKRAVKKRYIVKSMFDPFRNEINENTPRVFMVCERR